VGTLTVAKILSNVRSDLNESSTTILSDAEITIILNMGYRDVCAKGLCYESKIAKTNISVSQKVVSLVGNGVIRVNYVEYKSGATQGGWGLLCALPQTFGHASVDGSSPQYWFQWGDYLILDPVPDVGTYDLEIYAACYPTVVLSTAGTDLPASNLPVEFHESVYLFTLAFSALKLRRWADAAMAYNQYIVEVQRKRNEYVMKYPEGQIAHRLPDTVTMETPDGR
jgi:hypothetical protein